MSKVYSFRVDVDNPREAQASEGIDTWVSQGYSLRHILTDALINYGDNGDAENGWEKIFDQILEIVRGLGNGVVDKESNGVNTALSPVFVDAMRKAVKQGIKTK